MNDITKIDIANWALLKIGQQRIVAIDDTTTLGGIINLCYKLVLRKVLSVDNWSFAIDRVQIPKLDDVPVYGFSYKYQLPNDYIKIVEVNQYVTNYINAYSTKDTSTYKIEGKQILTNLAAPLAIRYVRYVDDPTYYSSSFIECFACKLALEIAQKIVQDKQLEQILMQDFDKELAIAKQVNAIENPNQQLVAQEALSRRIY